MAYSTNQQVKEEFKDLPLHVTDTAIKTGQVDRFIAEADAEIDGRLAVRYAVPIVAAASLPILRKISIGLTAGRIKNMLPVVTGDDSKNQGNSFIAGRLEKEARALLEDIVNQKILLSGATAATTHQGVKSGNVDAGVCHKFKRDTDQW